MKVVSKLQKERLTKDVRYQEFNELTLDQKACEGSTGQGLVLFYLPFPFVILSERSESKDLRSAVGA